MHYDSKGTDAWWIQSPSSVFGNGHTSVLLQEKTGYWWYFYWSGENIQFFFIGTASPKDLNKKINRIINVFKLRYNLNIDSTYYYTEAIKIKGNFKYSVLGAINTMRVRSYISGAKSYSLRFNPQISDKAYKSIDKKNINKKLRAKTHQYYYGKLRPICTIIVGNPSYHFLTNNCLDVSLALLMGGELSNSSLQEEYENDLELMYYRYIRPDSAYDYFLKRKYGKSIKIYPVFN